MQASEARGALAEREDEESTYRLGAQMVYYRPRSI
jgi:hypothetical protein